MRWVAEDQDYGSPLDILVSGKARVGCVRKDIYVSGTWSWNMYLALPGHRGQEGVAAQRSEALALTELAFMKWCRAAGLTPVDTPEPDRAIAATAPAPGAA